jgi:hypothetical protein
MLDHPELASKLVFGSDFPLWTIPWSMVGQLGYNRVAELRKIENPFTRAIETLKDLGVTPDIFTRAKSILRIPHGKQTEVCLPKSLCA